MIDYFLRFETEADAITAATGSVLGQYDGQNVWHWNTHFVLADVKAWRISQDNPSPDSPPDSPPGERHNYLSGWMCIVATKNVNPQLSNDPNLQFALNRDGPPWVVRNNIGAVLQDVGVQPIFCGSRYPMGGYG